MTVARLVPERYYYGWVILAAAVLAMALGSGVSFWAFGLYVEPMEDEFGWSRAEVSAGFSVSLAMAGLSGPFIGRWVDRRGPREAILVGAVLTAASYVLLATTNSLWQWFVFLAINAVFRQLMFFIPFQALLSRWFDKKRGLALGILGTGFSLGGFVVVGMTVVIDELGWDGSFIFTSVLIAAIYVPMTLWVLKNNPSDVGANIDGESHEDAEVRRAAGPLKGLTLREALKTPIFWLIAFAMTFFIFGIFGWLVHQVPFYESVGINRSVAGGLVTIVAAGGIVARLVFGFTVDRFARIELPAMVLLSFLSASFVALLVDSSWAGIGVFMALWVIGSGGGPLLEPLLLTRSFGLAHFGTILGTVAMVETIGIISSPTLIGAIFDETGSYDWALVLMMGAFLTALTLFFFASRLPQPIESLAPVLEPEEAAEAVGVD